MGTIHEAGASATERRRALVFALDSLNRKADYLKLAGSNRKVMAELLRRSIEAGSPTVVVHRKLMAHDLGISVLSLDKSLAILERWEWIEESYQGTGYLIHFYPWEGQW